MRPLAVLALVLSVAACDTPAVVGPATPTPTATPPPGRQLTVTSAGFAFPESPFSFASLAYGVTIRNESAIEAAGSVDVHVSFADANGAVVVTDTVTIMALGPGEETGVAGNVYSTAANAASIAVEASADDWSPSAVVPAFTFSSIAYAAERYAQRVTAQLTSPFDTELKNIRVSVFGLDPAGKIVGAGFTYLAAVPANGTSAVSAYYTGATPTSVTLYGQRTWLSSSAPQHRVKATR